MAYDTGGRWVPDEDLTWSRDTEAQKQALRMELTKAGLDWRHRGKYAFRTDAWGAMTEGERFDVLQQYDTWYDKGGQLALNDEAWGLDIERGITYNEASTWSAQEKFHNLTGGDAWHYEVEKTKGELQNPENYRDKVRDTIVGSREEHEYDDEGNIKDTKTFTTLIGREYPMDWANYSHDDLYRSAIDELLETDYDMFMGPGSDFDTAKQVRAATGEIKSWADHHYNEARRLGKDGDWAEAQLQADIELQIQRGKIYNKRYPEGRNTRGFQHNQQVQIRKYKQFQKFDEETGTVSRYHPITGELREEHTYQAPAPPVRMTITGDRTLEDVDAGRYYSPTVGFEQKITDSLADEPDPIDKPTLSIRKLGPLDDAGQGKARKPDNIQGWKETGVVK